MIGRFYLDMHPRPGKFSHAEMVRCWMEFAASRCRKLLWCCNFPAPTADDAGLMEYGDVQTFFHEFGHLMHHILGGSSHGRGSVASQWNRTSEKRRRRMLEEFIRSPEVLASFAHHYKTGEPIPAELVAA